MGDLKRYVYIIETERERRRYYTGLTSDLVRRLAAHNAGQCISTAALRPWRIVNARAMSEFDRLCGRARNPREILIQGRRTPGARQDLAA